MNIGVADKAKNKVPLAKTRRMKKKQCLTFMMEMRDGFNDEALLICCFHRRVLKQPAVGRDGGGARKLRVCDQVNFLLKHNTIPVPNVRG